MLLRPAAAAFLGAGENPIADNRQLLGCRTLSFRRHGHVFNRGVDRALFRLADHENGSTAALHDGRHGTQVHTPFRFATASTMTVEAIGAKDGQYVLLEGDRRQVRWRR